MGDQSINVSVIEPIGPAVERVKVMLFRPFDLGRWFVIGFCAWLAYLGKQGGGPNLNFSGRREWRTAGHELEAAKEFIIANMFWIAPLAVAAAVASIAVMLLLTWLSSRGRFMLLHCVAEDKAEVKIPWRKFKDQANSLFLFRIVLGLIGFATIALPVLLGIFFFVFAAVSRQILMFVSGLVMLSLIVLLAAIAFGIVGLFTMDFVVPIMFMRRCSCIAAWREFLGLLSANKGRFILYVLFQIFLAVIIGMIVIAGACLTCCCCCCACCVLALPYIGTVALLPIFVFDRAYSLCYLRQYGPQYDVFSVPVKERTPSETGG